MRNQFGYGVTIYNFPKHKFQSWAPKQIVGLNGWTMGHIDRDWTITHLSYGRYRRDQHYIGTTQLCRIAKDRIARNTMRRKGLAAPNEAATYERWRHQTKTETFDSKVTFPRYWRSLALSLSIESTTLVGLTRGGLSPGTSDGFWPKTKKDKIRSFANYWSPVFIKHEILSLKRNPVSKTTARYRSQQTTKVWKR